MKIFAGHIIDSIQVVLQLYIAECLLLIQQQVNAFVQVGYSITYNLPKGMPHLHFINI